MGTVATFNLNQRILSRLDNGVDLSEVVGYVQTLLGIVQDLQDDVNQLENRLERMDPRP
jgi:hypothetical protein